MDAWNSDQLRRMQLGGNGALNEFLARYGVPKSTDIKLKYNSQAAEFYREKIRAGLEGRAYTPPPPSEVGPPKLGPPARAPSSGSLRRGPSASSLAGAADGGWDSWDEPAGAPPGRTSPSVTGRSASRGARLVTRDPHAAAPCARWEGGTGGVRMGLRGGGWERGLLAPRPLPRQGGLAVGAH